MRFIRPRCTTSAGGEHVENNIASVGRVPADFVFRKRKPRASVVRRRIRVVHASLRYEGNARALHAKVQGSRNSVRNVWSVPDAGRVLVKPTRVEEFSRAEGELPKPQRKPPR